MKFLICCTLIIGAVFYTIFGVVDSFSQDADEFCKQADFKKENPELCE